MTNNLNKIEDNLYRLGVDAEGDVPEMVAELKEAYRKAEVLDRVKAFAEEPPFLLANNEHEDYEHYAYDQILGLIKKYESGDSND